MRALQKMITFRILATLSTVGVAWWATGSYHVGATVGTGTLITNSALYYLHEKAWEKKEVEK